MSPVAVATLGASRNTVGSGPVTAIMSHRSLAPSFSLLVVVAACSQMPSRPLDTGTLDTGKLDTGTQGARYVNAAVLTRGDEHSNAEVLTVVALQHISAADAEARLQAILPEGVRVGRAGDAKSLAIQGPGRAVTKSIKELERIDVR